MGSDERAESSCAAAVGGMEVAGEAQRGAARGPQEGKAPTV